MQAYFQYLQKMFIEVFTNIGNWFNDRYACPWGKVPGEFSTYSDFLKTYSSNFGFWGWFFYVFMLLVIIGLIAGLCFLLFLLARKYVRFYKTELDKDSLKKQIEKLNYQLYIATVEKARIMNLKAEALGLTPEEIANRGGVRSSENTETVEEDTQIRFPKLIAVDEKYKNIDVNITMDETNSLTLEEICQRFRLFAASQFGLYYTLDTMKALFAGMGTSKLIILEGISGTGKTSLPYVLGRFLQNNAKICSVQPSWRDRSELLGYYNEFTHKFTETDFLRAVYEATYRKDVNVVVLDEMNLARIEYYFAEFLSIMEMPNVSEWNIELIASPQPDDPTHIKDGKLLIPQNVWFVGTANRDDSTFTITDKVYDRAITIFFDNKGIAFDCDFTESLQFSAEYLQKLFDDAQKNYPVSEVTMEKFERLDAFVIQNFKLAFGNRIMKQLGIFVPIYVACGGTELQGVDYIFCYKILKKFETLNIAFLKDELANLVNQLNKLFGKNEFVLSKRAIDTLIKMNG